MKLLGFALALGVAPIIHLTCAQATGDGGRPSATRAGISRFAEEDVPVVGVVAVHAVASGDEQLVEDVVKKLEAANHTTGETPCPRPCNLEHASGYAAH